MEITKETCIRARKLMEESLPEILSKMDLTVTIGRMTFSDDKFTCNLECRPIPDRVKDKNPQAVKEAMERDIFERNAAYFRGKPEWFGQLTVVDGKIFKVVGLKTSARKNAFLIQNPSNGVQYVTDADAIAFGIELYQKKYAPKTDG